MNIIGVGNTGCSIVERLHALGPYNCYYIDDIDRDVAKFYKVAKQSNPEDYESSCPRLGRFFSGLKGETYIFLNGADLVSSSLLAICNQIRKKVKINVFYVKPDTDLLSNQCRIHERMVRNVCQQYARSSLFETMYIASVNNIESMIQESTIHNHEAKILELLCYCFHMLTIFSNKKPVVSNTSALHPTARIATIGFFDFEKNIENLFFPLEMPREIRYYFGINENSLEKDLHLFGKIKNYIKQSKLENVNITHQIHSLEKDDVYLVAKYSSLVQELDLDR